MNRFEKASLEQCEHCEHPDHNNQTLCRTARITDEIMYIILYGAHTILMDIRHRYEKLEDTTHPHQKQYVKVIDRGNRHAGLLAGRAARFIRNNITIDLAYTLDCLWTQRAIDGSHRKIKAQTVTVIAAAWAAWARSFREDDLEWLSKPNTALYRLISAIHKGEVVVDDELVDEYVPFQQLKKIYLTQDIEKRIQKKALELQIPYHEIYDENMKVNKHKNNLVHYWVTNSFEDGELTTNLIL